MGRASALALGCAPNKTVPVFAVFFMWQMGQSLVIATGKATTLNTDTNGACVSTAQSTYWVWHLSQQKRGTKLFEFLCPCVQYAIRTTNQVALTTAFLKSEISYPANVNAPMEPA